MSDKQVSVKDCPTSKSLYKVSDYKGTFYVSQVDVGFISNSLNQAGTARTFRDALELVKAHSGGNNLQISDW